jgi:hypothetical protein
MVVCGQSFSEPVLERLRLTIQREPKLSRRALSRRLCEWLDWKSPNGRLKEMSARCALLRLHRRRLLRLPPARRGPARRRRLPAPAPLPPVRGSVEALQDLELVPVGGPRSASARLWKQLIAAHHYLGYRPACGAQQRYLVRCTQGVLGALSFSAAAWRLAARDRWIGWSDAARRVHLPQVVANDRFLILPSVRVKNLASRVLALAAMRLPENWQARYGYRPLLLETFVQSDRFAGTCYRAANWVAVGPTAGRSRQDRQHRAAVPRKTVFVYPLVADARGRLRVKPAASPGPVSCAAQVSGPPVDWAEAELGQAGLGDARLQRRLLVVARDFWARPTASIPQACGGRAKTKAAYRLFDHPAMQLDAVLRPHYAATQARVASRAVVLAVQDTTTLNYSAHPATEDLGPITNRAEGWLGLHLHSTMAYDGTGTALGLLDVQCWARDPKDFGKKHRRHRLPIEQKESVKWLKSYQAACAVAQACPGTTVVSVGDREADVYELFVAAREAAVGGQRRAEVLVRAMRERTLAESDTRIWAWLPRQKVAGHIQVSVPARAGRPARVARLAVRYAAVELKPPTDKKPLGGVAVWAVLAQEVGAPKDVEPLCWQLLTTLPVASFERAVEMLRWYAQRFQIEVFHRTLKSGCRMETRQLREADRLEACLAVDLVVAWRLVHLTKLGRETPTAPCTVFFQEVQWQVLVAALARDPAALPQPPPLQEAVRMVARLGGFLGRNSDGEPGVTTLWRGWQRLEDMVAGWQLAHAFPTRSHRPVSSDRRYG